MDTEPFPAVADQRLLDALERAFARHAAGSEHIDAGRLKEALGLRSEYLAQRVLAAFDRTATGSSPRRVPRRRPRARLRQRPRQAAFAFRVHDHDGDGGLSPKSAADDRHQRSSESRRRRSAPRSPPSSSRAPLSGGDRDRDGRLSFDELAAASRDRPELLAKMTRSEAQWIAPNEDLLDSDRRGAPQGDASGAGRDGRFARRHRRRLVRSSSSAARTSRRSPSGASSTPNADVAMQIGHATGAALDLNGALILIPDDAPAARARARRRARKSRPRRRRDRFHRVVGHAMFALALRARRVLRHRAVAGHPRSRRAILLFASERGLTGVSSCVFA